MRYNTPELLLIGAAQTLVQNETSEHQFCERDNDIGPDVSRDPGEW